MNYHELHFHEIDSTNNYLKNSYRLLNNFTFVSAGYQNKGKGRNDRLWLSEKGQNLMFSFLIKDENLLKQSAIISLLTAVEIAKVLEQYKINDVSIKWPNDVLTSDKKVCGILAEAQLPDYLVVGVGLNVNQKTFPSNLRRPASSLSLILNQEIEINELKNHIYERIISSLTKVNIKESLDYLRKHNYLVGKKVKTIVNNQLFIGEVIDIDDSFCLQIATHGMLLHIDSGEIEIDED